MDVRYSPDPKSFLMMDSDELRDQFLIDAIFEKDAVPMVYSDIDRSITGSAVPVEKTLKLEASKKEMAANYFLERRELGIINIGAAGKVKADGEVYEMEPKDALYLGRGVKEVTFESNDKSDPAMFYFVSYPAHTEYPSKKASNADAAPVKLGSLEDSNARTIYKYIHPGGIKSCQLVMGLTELETGSVWNTMPCHTHQRRSEVYMYFGLKPESIVVHVLGEPEETRHIMMRDKQAVLNPSWSIHSGAGTQNYSFIWAMGGENQEFDDMDWVSMDRLK